MPDPADNKKVKGKARFWQNFKTPFIKLKPATSGVWRFRWAGKGGADILYDHFTRDRNAFGVTRDLISMLKSKIDKLIKIEKWYSEIGYPAEEDNNKPCYIDKIQDRYCELGPHFDMDVLQAEINYFEYGTGSTETPEIDINIHDSSGNRYRFPVPRTVPLLYPDPEKPDRSVEHQLSCWGYTTAGTYEIEINNKIDQIKRDCQIQVDSNPNFSDDIEAKKLAKQRIDDICEAAKYCISKYIAQIKKDDKKEASNLKQKEPKIVAIKGLVDDAIKIRPGANLKDIRYWHTFLIVRPQIYDASTGDTTDLTEDHVTPRNQAIRTEWGERENKLGYDAYGHPLEVNENGEVLLDIWYKDFREKYPDKDFRIGAITIKAPLPNITTRKFDPKFIRPVDPLEVVNYLHNEWDEYRDDIRDARFHPRTLLAVDYAMATNPQLTPGKLWKSKGEYTIEKMEEDAAKKNYRNPSDSYRAYKLKFSTKKHLVGEKYPDDGLYPGKGYPPLLRRTGDLTPAFDKRAYNMTWQYVGRKFYWATIDIDDREDQYDPTITTRGLSMYLLNRIRLQLKDVEAMEYLHEKILGQIGDFDYGPRAFPKKGQKTLTGRMPFRQEFQLK